VFTVVFALISTTCLVRLVIARRNSDRPPGTPGRHEDVGHLVMGISMIAMVLSWTALLPTLVWIVLFGGQAAVFGVLLCRGHGHHAAHRASPSGQENWDHTHHVMASLAMVYMVVAMRDTTAVVGVAGMPGMGAGPSTTGWVPLADAFGVYFLICAVWAALRAVRLAPSPSPVPATAGPGTAEVWSSGGLPALLGRALLVDGCQALMGGAMAYLLLV
jgi:hypothetical protein